MLCSCRWQLSLWLRNCSHVLSWHLLLFISLSLGNWEDIKVQWNFFHLSSRSLTINNHWMTTFWTPFKLVRLHDWSPMSFQSLAWSIIGHLSQSITRFVLTDYVQIDRVRSRWWGRDLACVGPSISILNIFDDQDPLVRVTIVASDKAFIRGVRVFTDSEDVDIAMADPSHLERTRSRLEYGKELDRVQTDWWWNLADIGSLQKKPFITHSIHSQTNLECSFFSSSHCSHCSSPPVCSS